MKKYLLLLINSIIIFSLSLTTAPVFSESTSITVATAANVQFAMDELKAEFKKQTGIETKIVLNSSGKLAAQIKNGAPFDIFMSADMDFPEKLYQDGLTTGEPKAYAYGTLVVWTMKNLALSEGIKLLSSSKIEKIAVANPKIAPYGEEAINALNYYKIYDNVKGKFVFGESISQVNSYIFTNSVDIGFTSKSVVLSPKMKNKGKWQEVDKKSYKPIAQGIVILKYGKENNHYASRKFYDFIFSQKARKVFERYGYLSKNNE